jgi:acyl-coenzyme A synthetase/AMP-(fatty) acid ligase
VIPFTYKLQNEQGTTNLIWLNLTDNQVELYNSNRNYDQWILGNLNFMGYYRVNYDEFNWRKIIQQLKTNHLVFSPTERAALIYDAFTLAR